MEHLVVAIFYRQQHPDLLQTFDSVSAAFQETSSEELGRILPRLKIVIVDNGTRPDLLGPIEELISREGALLKPLKIEGFRLPLPKSRGEVFAEFLKHADSSSYVLSLESGMRVPPSFFKDLGSFLDSARSELPIVFRAQIVHEREPSYLTGWILPRELFYRVWTSQPKIAAAHFTAPSLSQVPRILDEELSFELEEILRNSRFSIEELLSLRLKDDRVQREWDEWIYLKALRQHAQRAFLRPMDRALGVKLLLRFAIGAIKVLARDLWTQSSWTAFFKNCKRLFSN